MKSGDLLRLKGRVEAMEAGGGTEASSCAGNDHSKAQMKVLKREKEEGNKKGKKEEEREDCKKRKIAFESEPTKRSRTAHPVLERASIVDNTNKSRFFPHCSSRTGQVRERISAEAKVLVPETIPMFQETALPEDPVPETVPVLADRVLDADLLSEPEAFVEEQIFPGPAGLVRRVIPETPEKSNTMMSEVDSRKPKLDSLLQTAHPDLGKAGVKKVPSPTTSPRKETKKSEFPILSPVIKPGKDKGRSKLRNVNNKAANEERDRRMLAKKSLASQEDEEEPVVANNKEERGNTKKVGRMAPSLQGEIDKKAFEDLDKDFPGEKCFKIQHESDSDFESPNLLARRPKRANREMAKKEGGSRLKLKQGEINGAKSPVEDEVGATDQIENPNSSVEIVEAEKEKKIEAFLTPIKKQKSITKSTNRWGIEVDATTDSQKKRLKNQKQVGRLYFRTFF